MLVVKNDRDLYLQGNVTRLNSEGLPGNVVIPGLKQLVLRGSASSFTVDGTGAAVGVSEITVEATKIAIAGDVVWQVTDGTATLTGAVAGQKTLTLANMLTDSVTISAHVQDLTTFKPTAATPLDTYTDSVVITKSYSAATLPVDGVVTFTAVGGIDTVDILAVSVDSLAGRKIELWRSLTTNLVDAVLVDAFEGTMYTDKGRPLWTTYHYWIRVWNPESGLFGLFIGPQSTTTGNVTTVIQGLANSIGSDELTAALRDPITRIPGINLLPAEYADFRGLGAVPPMQANALTASLYNGVWGLDGTGQDLQLLCSADGAWILLDQPYSNKPLPINPSEDYIFSLDMMTDTTASAQVTGNNVFLVAQFYDQAGVYISDSPVADFEVPAVSTRIHSLFTSPANAAFISLKIGSNAHTGSGDIYHKLNRLMLEKAGTGQTEPSPWSPGYTSAMIQQQMRVDVAKALATWGIKIDSGDGRISSIILTDDGTESTFAINSDNFAFYDATSGDLAIGYTTGKTFINGLYVNELNVSKLVGSAGEFDTLYANTLTVTNGMISGTLQSSSYSASGGWQLLQSGQLTAYNAYIRGDVQATSLSAATGTFSGSLSAATGTFSGSLTASAVNAVDTINIAGNAVTIPAAGTGSTSASVTINPLGGGIIAVASGKVNAYFTGGGDQSTRVLVRFRLSIGGTIYDEYQSAADFDNTGIDLYFSISGVKLGAGNTTVTASFALITYNVAGLRNHTCSVGAIGSKR